MSDIIARAKDALEHSSPRPWKMDLSSPNMNGQNFCIRTDGTAGTFLIGFATRHMADLPLIEAAPELAQALAEETWEYTQEIYFNEKWQPIYEDLWFETPEECDGLWLDIEPWKWNNEPLRIVRRRVSPVEVVDD